MTRRIQHYAKFLQQSVNQGSLVGHFRDFLEALLQTFT
jgi:hypothetical protein